MSEIVIHQTQDAPRHFSDAGVHKRRQNVFFFFWIICHFYEYLGEDLIRNHAHFLDKGIKGESFILNLIR